MTGAQKGDFERSTSPQPGSRADRETAAIGEWLRPGLQAPEGRCSGELCWYTLPLVDGLIVAHSKAGVLDVCEGGGQPPLPASTQSERRLAWFSDEELASELARRRASAGPS